MVPHQTGTMPGLETATPRISPRRSSLHAHRDHVIGLRCLSTGRGLFGVVPYTDTTLSRERGALRLGSRVAVALPSMR